MKGFDLPLAKALFLAPGPVPVPQAVWEAMAQPVIHHRGPAFSTVMQRLHAGLRYVFQTAGETGVIAGSGTFAVETAMYSLFRPGERVLVVNNGKFSERWEEYGRLLGLDVRSLTKPWGEAANPEELVALATLEPAVHGVVITHCETSTGALIDLESAASAVRAALPDVLLLADAITTVGALPFYLDAWGLDAAVVAAQKAFMNPAGTFAWALGERGLERLRPSAPGDFANWHNYVLAGRQQSYPYTPPLAAMYGWIAVLEGIADIGLPAVWNEVLHAARDFRSGLSEAGGQVIGASPSDSLTVFDWPGQSLQALNEHLSQAGITLAGGQGAWEGRILRISHMGSAARPEVVEEVLRVIRSFGSR